MMATSVRGAISLILRSRSDPERLGSFQVGDDNIGRQGFKQFRGRFCSFGFQADQAEALADGDAKPADAVFVVNNQKTKA